MLGCQGGPDLYKLCKSARSKPRTFVIKDLQPSGREKGTNAITASWLHVKRGHEHRAMLQGVQPPVSPSQQAWLVLVFCCLAIPLIGNAIQRPH